jgi:hypothetical protein
MYIYVLKCKNGKYYVGMDKNSYKNINDELINNINSEWIKKYKPVSILQVYNKCNKDDIDKYTEMYMGIYGINNVRGACSYNQILLDEKTNIYLKYKINDNTTKKDTNSNKTKKTKIKLPKIKKNRLLLNNYINNYDYENDYEEDLYLKEQREFIKSYSNNYTYENIYIENLSHSIVDDIISKGIENITLESEFDIINIEEYEIQKIENPNNGYLYNIFNYFCT